MQLNAVAQTLYIQWFRQVKVPRLIYTIATNHHVLDFFAFISR